MAYPVNRISCTDSSPCEPRIGVRPRLRMVPLRLPHRMNIVELRKATNIRSPSEIIHNEALDTCGLRCIDHCSLMVNAGRPDNADNGILPEQSLD